MDGHDGIICTGESYKDKIKLTFIKDASLKDPTNLFNASLDGNARRAIDIHKNEKVDETSFKALITKQYPSTTLANQLLQRKQNLKRFHSKKSMTRTIETFFGSTLKRRPQRPSF